MDKALIKKYGEGAFVTGSQFSEYENEILHISPKIDLILGGGIPGGSVVTIAGDQKIGKTILSLSIIASAQKAGRKTFYLNVEGRLKSRDYNGIQGLDPDKINIVRSYKETDEDGKVTSKIFTAEEFLNIVEHLVHKEPGSVVVVDSISQLVTSGELEKEIGEKSRAPGAILMAQLCRKLSNVVPVNDIILVGILHYIANTSGFGKNKVVSGGRKIAYAADIALECKGMKYIKEGGEEGKIIGQSVDWITTSTAIAPPGQTTTSIIKYGIGIDKIAEIVDLGIEFGFIVQKGAWFALDFIEGEEKCHGKPNLIQRIKDNEDEREILQESINELLGV